MNYLEMNDKGKFAREEQLLADYFGKDNYVPFYHKHFIKNRIVINKNDFIAGTIPVIFNAFKKLKIDYKHDDYPDALKKYLHRHIWYTKLGYLKNKVYNDELINGVFVKPYDKLKRFTGFVLTTSDDWKYTNGAGDSTKVTCSEPVKWLTEYRVPVVNGKALDYCNYSGTPDIEIDKAVVDNMIADWKDAPSAYALDVGLLETGETALVEINDAFALGSYSMSSEVYGKLLTTRWKELTNND